jgi:hypothetical protein
VGNASVSGAVTAAATAMREQDDSGRILRQQKIGLKVDSSRGNSDFC